VRPCRPVSRLTLRSKPEDRDLVQVRPDRGGGGAAGKGPKVNPAITSVSLHRLGTPAADHDAFGAVS